MKTYAVEYDAKAKAKLAKGKWTKTRSCGLRGPCFLKGRAVANVVEGLLCIQLLPDRVKALQTYNVRGTETGRWTTLQPSFAEVTYRVDFRSNP